MAFVFLNLADYFCRPNEMNLTTLTGQREEFLDKYIYQLQISFDFTVENCTEIKILCPALGKFLYESDYFSQLWMLFDKRKQLITCGDAFDEKVSLSAAN